MLPNFNTVGEFLYKIELKKSTRLSISKPNEIIAKTNFSAA